MMIGTRRFLGVDVALVVVGSIVKLLLLVGGGVPSAAWGFVVPSSRPRPITTPPYRHRCRQFKQVEEYPNCLDFCRSSYHYQRTEIWRLSSSTPSPPPPTSSSWWRLSRWMQPMSFSIKTPSKYNNKNKNNLIKMERHSLTKGGNNRNITNNNNNKNDDEDEDGEKDRLSNNKTIHHHSPGGSIVDDLIESTSNTSLSHNFTTTTPTTNKNATKSSSSSSSYNPMMMKFPEISFSFPSISSSTSSSSSSSSSKKVIKPASPTAAAGTSTWVELLQQRNSNETVTVADLEAILTHIQETTAAQQQQQQLDRDRNYVLQPQYQQYDTTSGGIMSQQQQWQQQWQQNPKFQKTSSSSSTSSKYYTSPTQQVAFPQPSTLSGRDIQRGTSVASTFLGLIISVTILPNLWLVGSGMGTLYGLSITKDLVEKEEEDEDDEEDEEDDSIEDEDDLAMTKERRIRRKSILARSLIAAGSQLATWALQLYDYWKAMFFLYKTGQLSYEYWKTYSSLDQRFAIQDKIDAWNSRFAKGKQKFDAWEQQNEVGRTILAGLRTVWLLDEQQRKRVSTRQTSQYRLLQYLYNIKYWMTRRLVKARKWVSKQFAPGGSFQDIVEGIRLDLMSQGSTKSRIGSVVTAIVVINVFGSLFSLSPAFCSLTASLFAVIWPSWGQEFFTRVRELGDEFQDRGKTGIASSSSIRPSSGSNTGSTGFSAPRLLGMYDKNRYNYYVRPDGRKKYYRVVQFDNPNSPAVQQRRRKKKKTSKKQKSKQDNNSFWDSFSFFNSNEKTPSRKDDLGTWGFFRKVK